MNKTNNKRNPDIFLFAWVRCSTQTPLLSLIVEESEERKALWGAACTSRKWNTLNRAKVATERDREGTHLAKDVIMTICTKRALQSDFHPPAQLTTHLSAPIPIPGF